MGRMVIVILAVGLCVVLCQEKKGPDKLVDKQVTDGQEKQQRVGDKNNNEKDLGENGDKQDGHDQVNQTNGGDDKDDTHGDIKNQDAADYHGDAADGDGEGNHGDGEGNHGDGEVHKKTTEKAIVSDKDLINDPAFNVTKIFPTQAPQPVNKVTTLLIMTHGEGKYFLHNMQLCYRKVKTRRRSPLSILIKWLLWRRRMGRGKTRKRRTRIQLRVMMVTLRMGITKLEMFW
jgi:hypothetical protein